MANNRMVLWCTECQQAVSFGKYMPPSRGGGWTFNPASAMSRTLTAFINRHLHRETLAAMPAEGPTHFEVGYESRQRAEGWEYETK